MASGVKKTAKRQTFASKDEFVTQVASAVRAVAPKFGFPTGPTDAFVTAHAALSCGWGRSLWAWNLWGLKAGDKWIAAGGNYWESMTTEYVDGGNTPVRESAKWRHFETPEEAVYNYFSLLTDAKRYNKSEELLRQGSEDFMFQLGVDGWYTKKPVLVSDEWKSIVKRVCTMLPAAMVEGRKPTPAIGTPTPELVIAREEKKLKSGVSIILVAIGAIVAGVIGLLLRRRG